MVSSFYGWIIVLLCISLILFSLYSALTYQSYSSLLALVTPPANASSVCCCLPLRSTPGSNLVAGQLCCSQILPLHSLLLRTLHQRWAHTKLLPSSGSPGNTFLYHAVGPALPRRCSLPLQGPTYSPWTVSTPLLMKELLL